MSPASRKTAGGGASSRKVDRRSGVLCDQDIRITGSSAHKYPDLLRRVRFKTDDGNVYDFLTNRFDLAVSTIADIYKARCDIKLFFKWFKQNLKIKSYPGTSENAVFTQIWIAVCAYLMLSYHRFISKSDMAMSRILSVIQIYILSTRPIDELPHKKRKYPQNSNVAIWQLSVEGI